ncbi:PP2C family protein-serine/threonine phosphatase [Nocardioides marmoribigeumensis]|uniref:Sigma-B regulation protein RsbU (Phosphoserine phosphatase) n=1 Tax=Nocardioides marmoribigeumensis TaxID=433649 RepID=A0ABU2C0C9_9ACTN|nr:SpoIIE family protein phosphatase [Nocardioides marmoribigeumensis]MDR7364092.1 sigma-B regulation protein RsbU (phosphoserine phosphatase) [Nocardioides marmoribigeumensis]
MPLTRADEAFARALLEDDPVALYERAPCGYLSTTADGVLTKANATFLAWTGYEVDDVVGQPFTALLTKGGKIFHETHYAPMLRLQGFVRELAVDLVRKDGSRLPVLLNASLDRGDDGEPRVVRLAVFDATERRRYERELLRATQEAEAARARAEAAERRSRVLVDTLQQTLVPGTLPVVEGLELHGGYRPAGDGAEVGGDFYDVFPTSPDECWLILGDVSGKGVEAAVVTSLVRHATRVLVATLSDPVEVLAQLDVQLQRHDTDRYCTAVLVRMRRLEGTWEVLCASGGHPPALLRSGAQEASAVHPGGQVLGLVPHAEFASTRLTLGAGETLLLYTDGITEGRNPGGFFGERRLLETVSRAPSGARPLVETVLAAALEFQGDHTSDDIACLAVTVTAGEPTAQVLDEERSASRA